MTGVIAHSAEPFDEFRHARQRPQLRGEAVAARPPEQGRLQASQLPAIQARLSSQSPRRLQPLSTSATPRVIPPMRRLPTHLQGPHDGGLRLPAPIQPRGFEAARFQRSWIPLPAVRIGHASASDGSR